MLTERAHQDGLIIAGFRVAEALPARRNGLDGLRFRVERAKGIEPSPRAWEARVLPLNYARRRGDSSRAI
jgi:hypothetical protein